jgi:hypothetical protein
VQAWQQTKPKQRRQRRIRGLMMSSDMKARLLAMVLGLCESYGLTTKEIVKIFNKETIEDGMKIIKGKR